MITTGPPPKFNDGRDILVVVSCSPLFGAATWET